MYLTLEANFIGSTFRKIVLFLKEASQ